MAGKGSNTRPFSVDQKTFADNWDNIFNKSNNVWYLVAINPWYKILFNPATKQQKKIPLK